MSRLNRPALVALLSTSAAIIAGTTAAGAAGAETMTPVTGGNDTVSFSRTVGSAALVDGKVKVGDTVTITNRIDRKLGWLVYSVRDNHPSCMKAVPNTSVWTVSGGTYTNNPDGPGTKKPNEVTSGDGWVMIDATGGGSWEAKPLIWTQDYTVECAPGTLNTGGLQWSTTNVFEKNNNQSNVGPTITVETPAPKTASATAVSVTPAPKAGETSTVKATVTAGGSGATGGTVEFFNNGASIGTGTVAAGVATTNWKPAAGGAYSLKAVYSGTATIEASNATITGTVAAADPEPEPGAPVIAVNGSPKVGTATPVVVTSDASEGSAVTLTANGAAICSGLVLANGKATCQWTPTTAGAVELKAVVGAKSSIRNLVVEAAGGGDPGDGGGDPGGPGDGGDPDPGTGGDGGSTGSLGGGSLGGLFGGSLGGLFGGITDAVGSSN
ncbi:MULTISPECIES: Ig-like domain-containing protein [Gordonia]|uniref:Bacterial Ig-like domain-containing protein n=4 Tax=Gordonia TaxID=2053 RepID=L7LK31_9ACTN|nr:MULTISPECIES: Ig-like domain-containing protein [Gordonia]AUH70427.1 hypothetical protein CXX93_15910 [Gordonia sp. YC-JH1]WFN93986.1 Ig-like domain-containing protein [Gordonia sihwensis]GAC61101.1 hypothetical protein GSI01S_14_01190 [Gordonia sihwensis NBRC 108236]